MLKLALQLVGIVFLVVAPLLQPKELKKIQNTLIDAWIIVEENSKLEYIFELTKKNLEKIVKNLHKKLWIVFLIVFVAIFGIINIEVDNEIAKDLHKKAITMAAIDWLPLKITPPFIENCSERPKKLPEYTEFKNQINLLGNNIIKNEEIISTAQTAINIHYTIYSSIISLCLFITLKFTLYIAQINSKNVSYYICLNAASILFLFPFTCFGIYFFVFLLYNSIVYEFNTSNILYIYLNRLFFEQWFLSEHISLRTHLAINRDIVDFFIQIGIIIKIVILFTYYNINEAVVASAKFINFNLDTHYTNAIFAWAYFLGIVLSLSYIIPTFFMLLIISNSTFRDVIKRVIQFLSEHSQGPLIAIGLAILGLAQFL